MTESTAQPMMTFGTAIITVLRKYATFDGRAARPEFWWFVLFTAIVMSALGALNLTTPDGVITFGSGLGSVWAIAMVVPVLAVTVRRLRDTGRNWNAVFWILVPIAGVIVLVLYLAEPSKPDESTPEHL